MTISLISEEKVRWIDRDLREKDQFRFGYFALEENSRTIIGYFWRICCYLVAKLSWTLLWLHGLYLARLLYPWDFSGKNTGVGCHFLLQGIFLTQGLNSGLLHCRQILYQLSLQGSPFSTWECMYVNLNLPIHPTPLSSHPMITYLFSTSGSLFLLCK